VEPLNFENQSSIYQMFTSRSLLSVHWSYAKTIRQWLWEIAEVQISSSAIVFAASSMDEWWQNLSGAYFGCIGLDGCQRKFPVVSDESLIGCFRSRSPSRSSGISFKTCQLARTSFELYFITDA
jgi:hypothetical protein